MRKMHIIVFEFHSKTVGKGNFRFLSVARKINFQQNMLRKINIKFFLKKYWFFKCVLNSWLLQERPSTQIKGLQIKTSFIIDTLLYIFMYKEFEIFTSHPYVLYDKVWNMVQCRKLVLLGTLRYNVIHDKWYHSFHNYNACI